MGILGWVLLTLLVGAGGYFLHQRKKPQAVYLGALLWAIAFVMVVDAIDGIELFSYIGALAALVVGGGLATLAAFNDADNPPRERGKTAVKFTVVACVVMFGLVAWGGHLHNVAEAAAKALASSTVTVDGKKLEYRDNASQKGASPAHPASGTGVVNASFAKPSLDCDSRKAVQSWRQLVACVEQAPKAQRDTYIQYVNANKQALGTDWSGVKRLAKLEVSDKLDTRVILALNSEVSESKARDLAREAAGDAASKLPFTRTNGAIVNTRGGVGERFLEEWADGRSQVRVLLTVPDEFVAVSNTSGVKFGGDTTRARQGKGVEVECTNVTTGIVPKPQRPQGTGGETPTPRESTTPPTTPTPTPSGSTTPPETTPPPATSTPPTTPPSSTPPETTPPATTPPPSSPPPSTTPPETTPPPSSPPPTSPTPTPSCTEGPTCYPKGDTHTDEANEGKPPAASPSGDPDPTPKTEPTPANPSEKPGDPAPSVEAPGATQEPDPGPTPSPHHSVGSDPTAPESEDQDPDAVAYSTDDPTAGYLVAALCGALIAGMGGIRRRTRR